MYWLSWRMMMTMLTKKNWNEDEEWYEVPLDDEVHAAEIDRDLLDTDADYRFVAWYDRRSKNWIAYIVDARGCQIGSAYFAYSKRTFVY